MLNFLWSLFIGGILGLIAGAILGKEVPGGVSGNIIIGFLGSWLGELFICGKTYQRTSKERIILFK